MRYDPERVVCCITMMCYKHLNYLGSANHLSFLCKNQPIQMNTESVKQLCPIDILYGIRIQNYNYCVFFTLRHYFFRAIQNYRLIVK